MSAPSYMQFLPPETLAKLGRCELLARGVVEGFVSGKHKSPFKGFSVEFSEHRQYAPGDDLRNLDWRVLARKDRYYIKQYIEETNLRATLLLVLTHRSARRGIDAVDTSFPARGKHIGHTLAVAGLSFGFSNGRVFIFGHVARGGNSINDE